MKPEPTRVKLSRKQSAPRNLAAKALAAGQFKPKVEPDPKSYRRKAKHKVDPLAKAEADNE